MALRELGKRDRLPESRPARALPGAAVTAALCAVLRFKTTHCLRLGPSVPVCRGAGGALSPSRPMPGMCWEHTHGTCSRGHTGSPTEGQIANYEVSI